MSVANVMNVEGTLYAGVNTVSGSAPYGGAALGTYGGKKWQPRSPSFPIRAEEFGGVVSDVLYRGEDGILTAVLRTFEAASLSRYFPCYVAGAQGGAILRADADSSVRAGSLLGVSLGATLLFVPDAKDTFPSLLIRRAVPAIDETVSMAFSLAASDEWRVPLVWYATPDSAGKQYEYGLLRDMTY